MLQELLAPTFYFLLFLFLISNKRLFPIPSISRNVLYIGFSLKVFSALLFGFFFRNGILTGNDTFLYFYDGEIIYKTLKTDPFIYFKLAIGSNDFKPVPAYLLPYTDAMHFWFDSSNYFIVRLNALLRPFSFGVYNVHAIIFAFLSFIGTYNLYLFFQDKVRHLKMVQFILFGIPSIVFWTSGIHKESIVIFALGIILYNMDIVLTAKHTNRNILFSIAGLFILGYTRIYLLAFLLPLMGSIALYNKLEIKTSYLKVIALSAMLLVFVLLLLDLIIPNFSLTHEFLSRRTYFLNSPGNMSFQVEHLPHNFKGVLILLWEAFTNPFIRPLPNDCNYFLAYLASFESIILLLTIVALLFSSNLKLVIKNPYALFCILFGLSTLFLIGLIVNNSGAIVRYRSIAIPFILIGLCLVRQENKQTVLNSS